MIDERKPGIREWAKIRNRARQHVFLKFWYSTNSGSEVMTDIMNEEEAMEWLQNNSQPISAVFIQERMTSREAMLLLRRNGDDE